MISPSILTDMRLPRRLAAEGRAEKILQVLADRLIKLRPEDGLSVPQITLTDALGKALIKAYRQRRIQLGFEAVAERLAMEKRGLDALNQKSASDQGRRISRLLLFSNDGALRLYRHIEQTLVEHSGRLLGCMVDADSQILGRSVTGRDLKIKVFLVEHKDAVAEILQSLSV